MVNLLLFIIADMRMVLSIALLILLTGFGDASWQNGDDNVDRPYGDLPGMPVVLNISQPASVCAEMCQSNAQCVAWAYVKADCEGSSNPQCYLKAVVMKQMYNPCRVSSQSHGT